MGGEEKAAVTMLMIFHNVEFIYIIYNNHYNHTFTIIARVSVVKSRVSLRALESIISGAHKCMIILLA